MLHPLPGDAERPGTRGPIDVWLIDLAAAAGPLSARSHLFAGAGLLPSGHRDGAVRDPIAAASQATRHLAHVALRLLLAGYTGLDRATRPFAVGPAGKPSLAPAAPGVRPVEFSLAHAGSLALLAVSRDGPVGLDLEAPRTVRISDHRRAMLVAAAAALDPATPLAGTTEDLRMLAAWVRLEALAKATGEGIGALLGRLEDRARPLTATCIDGRPVQVRDLALDGLRATAPGHLAALAGTAGGLASPAPAPQVRAMPLDPSWLEGWLAEGRA